MNKGDLLRYIQNENELKFETIIKISLDIVKACEYLELVQLVHRYDINFKHFFSWNCHLIAFKIEI